MGNRKYRSNPIERMWNSEHPNSPIKRSELTTGVSHEKIEILPGLWEKLNKVSSEPERCIFYEFTEIIRGFAMLAKIEDNEVSINVKGGPVIEFMKHVSMIPLLSQKDSKLKEIYRFECSERAVELEAAANKLREKERKRLEREKKKAHLKEVQDYTDSLINPEDR